MDKHLRVVLSNETYPPDVNGSATFTERLARGLTKAGHKVLVIAPNTKFKDEIEKDETGFEIFRLKSIPLKIIHPYFRFVYQNGLRIKLTKKIKEFDPDIIHIQNHFALGRTLLKIARKTGVPIIGTNHFMPENLLQYVPEFAHDDVRKLMWSDFKKVYSKLDFVTSPSQAAIDLLKKIGLKNKMAAISNGIDLSRFKKFPPDKDLIAKYKINRNIPALLFVGRIEVDKNIDTLLKAAAIVLRRTPIQLILVGSGKNEQEFKDLANKLGIENKVIFTGRMDDGDLDRIYSLADVYMGTGTAELQGLSVMEAMAEGLPVIAANAVALPELVKDGYNGYLFKMNENDLADKIIKILSDKKRLKEMGENSFKAIQYHDVKNTIAKFVDLYKKIITEKRQVKK
ncbi:MAG: glycosyltransferase [Patescibacteria group bacterium]|nr:glycosyltransferase [Patescibacteria group bacterium]